MISKFKIVIVAAVFIFTFCGSFFFDTHIHAEPTVEKLRDAELNKYSSSYHLNKTIDKGNIKEWRYTRSVTSYEGNTCSRYCEIEKEYTLTIQINVEKEKASSYETMKVLSRNMVNGLD